MLKVFLLLPIISFVFAGCSNSELNKTTNNETTIVTLNMSNFNRYINCIRIEGYVGVQYKAWFEFKGALHIGVYDATVTYSVDGASYSFTLDASGSGKTDSFDRLVSSEVTNVSGTISYLEPNTKVDINTSNFNKYISCTRCEGYVGAQYKAWFAFEGALYIGVYDATVTYSVDGASYSFTLDASGSGKTDSFDRLVSSEVTCVSGFVKYSV